MYTCVAVVAVLFVWGVRAPLPPLSRRRRRRPLDGCERRRAALGTAALAALRDVVAQTKVAERRLPAALHLPLFYGMVLLFIGTAIVVALRGRPAAGSATSPCRARSTWCSRPSSTRAGLALVVGVVIALWRRFVMRPDHLAAEALHDAHPLRPAVHGRSSGFGLEAYRIAAQPNEWAAAAFVGWSPLRSCSTASPTDRASRPTRSSGGCTPPPPSA